MIVLKSGFKGNILFKNRINIYFIFEFKLKYLFIKYRVEKLRLFKLFKYFVNCRNCSQ